ncbi:MAG: hypothetical protein JW751_03860 [Polyangiaceae bacterium]|nr:hypothetical protein [Polyangiaceae bacterium]
MKTDLRAAGVPATPLPSEILSSLALELDAATLHCYLGYPVGVAPATRIAGDIARIVEGAWTDLSPRGAYVVLPIDGKTSRSLSLGDHLLVGQIAQHLAGAERLAVFMVTVGDAISHRSRQACRAGDAFAGWVLDALGSWAAEATTELVMLRLRSALDADEELTVRYSPGYCGMDLEQQRVLFELVDAAAIDVTLLPSCLMQPEKSVSGVVGIGSVGTTSLRGSPCDTCPEAGCHLRRVGYSWRG